MPLKSVLLKMYVDRLYSVQGNNLFPLYLWLGLVVLLKGRDQWFLQNHFKAVVKGLFLYPGSSENFGFFLFEHRNAFLVIAWRLTKSTTCLTRYFPPAFFSFPRNSGSTLSMQIFGALESHCELWLVFQPRTGYFHFHKKWIVVSRTGFKPWVCCVV